MNYSDFINSVIKISQEIRISTRIKLTKGKDQSILEEFIRPSWDSKEHRAKKFKFAEDLKNQGKNVFIEKCLTLNGIRIRPDICYLEDDRWNIIEIEFGGHHQNKIFKNLNVISKIANVKVMDIVYDSITKISIN
jgi:hypothetical protein